MRMFDERTSWVQCMSDLLKTDASLEAAGDAHQRLYKVIAALLERLDGLQDRAQAADDDAARAGAKVAFVDEHFDDVIGPFASQLFLDSGNDRDKPPYARFFREAPSEVIRLGLESQIKATATWSETSKTVPLSKAAQGRLATIEKARAQGATALKAREEAAKVQLGVALEFLAWKDDANAVRRSVWNQLDRYAIDNGLPRGYADRFFLSARAPSTAKRTKSKKATDEG